MCSAVCWVLCVYLFFLCFLLLILLFKTSCKCRARAERHCTKKNTLQKLHAHVSHIAVLELWSPFPVRKFRPKKHLGLRHCSHAVMDTFVTQGRLLSPGQSRKQGAVQPSQTGDTLHKFQLSKPQGRGCQENGISSKAGG